MTKNNQGVHLAALALTAAFLTHQARAEEDIFFGNLPIVASASRLPQKLSEAPAAMTVIDRDLIRASGARNVADLLRLVPGFQVTPANQDAAIVAYHGLSNEEYTPRVQVLIDGRSQYSPLFKSGVNWNLLPVVLENIERIEVIRGSNTVTYGSNAFLGVVNIITQDASQTKGWMISANHGNRSVRDETLRWGGKVGHADVRFTYNQLGDGGFRKALNGSEWFDPHDSRHARVIDLRADIPLTDYDELQLSLSQAADVSQYGKPNSLSDPFRDLSQSSTSLSAEWRRIIAPDEEFKLRFSHTEDWASGLFQERVSFTSFYGGTSTYYYPNNPGGKSLLSELEFQHIFAPWRQTRLLWGSAAKAAAVSSQYQFSSTDWKERNSYRLFGNLEWRPNYQWLFNVGSSLEHDSLSGLLFDPRGSASYHLTPENTLRLIASRAHRTPSLYEKLGDVQKVASGTTTPLDRVFLAAPGLRPETINTLELGYLGEFKPWRASLDVRAFRESIPDRIQIVPLALSAWTPDDRESNTLRNGLIANFANQANYPYGRADGAVNLEKAVIRGYEYQLRWQPLEDTRLIYNNALVCIEAGLTDEVVADDITGGNVAKISRQTRESAPTRSQMVMWMQQLPLQLQSSLMYYKGDAISWKRNNYSRPYERVDWRLALPIRLGTQRAELAYTSQFSNKQQDGRNGTRIATELHWLSLRLDF